MEFVRDQTVATWLGWQRRAFEWFGGCAAAGVIDNPECAIIRACVQAPMHYRTVKTILGTGGKLAYAEFLAMLVSDAVARREQKKFSLRLRRAQLVPRPTLR